MAALWGLWEDRAAKVRELDDLRIEMATQAAIAEQAKIAKAVLNQHLKRQDNERAQLQSDLEHLKNLEGHNAPMSDFLRNAFDRM